jgi:sigma-B regulation protein RsbU (phosphoserine phosphatase)
VTTSGITNKRAPLYVLLALVLLDLIFIVTGTAPFLSILLSIGLVGFGVAKLAIIALRRSHLIWRLRNRLIVTYVFIGAVPILLILALLYCGSWIVVGQVATYLVRTELVRRATLLQDPARVLSESKPLERDAMVIQMGPLFQDRAPGVEILITSDSGTPLRCPPKSTIEALPEAWKPYTGIVYKKGKYYLMSLAEHAGTRALLMAPLDPNVLENLVPGIGSITISDVTAKGGLVAGVAGTVPEAYNVLDREFWWGNSLDAAHWLRPNKPEKTLLVIRTRGSAVLGAVFADRMDSAQDSLIYFVGISILLALVELGAAAIGFSMTGAITGAVHNIYEGTLKIGKGDFSHRIPVKGHDQLADLGNSFNQMSEQLEDLLVVAKEKERLQSELTIASEVQKQLFPRSAPVLKTISLLGACEPARSASGDYYDYLCLANGHLALAIGDVAGKGISAALLMASIQSIIRTQLLAGQQGEFSTSALVAQLNRQLYGNTSPEKYATFFFGIYDEATRGLTYTNAGHLAPMILRDGKMTELEVTGTVVGLFPFSTYEEEHVTLAAGDLLVAYTDGITEPENEYGEEFGMERLAEAVLKNQKSDAPEIVAKVMEAVKQWSHSPELPDDMTVLIARGLH